MANHKSAEKRARQAIKRNARNSQAIGAARTCEKKLRTALAGGDSNSAKELLSTFMSKISQAAAGGKLHKKTAARKISRLSERVSKLSATK